VTSRPIWFGPKDRPLFGWLHEPDGAAASIAVVVCNSLGAEAHTAKPALKRLCEQLSDAGVTSLRFDYDGTGDSAGELADPGRVAAWLASIDAAICRLRESGFDRVTLVGIRMGALLAACAFEQQEDADVLVVWDPCVSSAAFMREQKLLFDVWQPGVTVTGESIEGLSYVFSSETVSDLHALRPQRSSEGSPRRILLLTRTGQPIADASWKWLGQNESTFRTATGQDELLGRSIETSVTPEHTISEIVSWITQNATGLRAIGREEVERHLEQITLEVQGQQVIESPMFAGETPLFGILTQPARPPMTTVVFLSMGRLDHTGPGRLWTDMARNLTSRGFRCLRIDGSGIGDSEQRQSIRSGKSINRSDDVRDLVREFGEDDVSSYVLIGVSSGGYYAARPLSPRPAGICLINPALSPEMRDIWRTAARNRPATLDSLIMPSLRHTPMRWIRGNYIRLKIRATAWIPLARAGFRGTPVLLILGSHDIRKFAPNPAWWVTRKVLESRRLLQVTELPYKDHSLESLAMRTLVAKTVSSWIAERFEDLQPTQSYVEAL
jgi:alpha-beta hydrolase superfamily lysophospholipase